MSVIATTTTAPASAGAYSFMGSLAIIRAASEQTGGSYCLLELHGTRGDMPPLHVHDRDDEAFYVIEGELRIHVGADTLCLGPGGCAVAPRGVPHTYMVESDRARWLVGSCAGFDRYVRELGHPLWEPGAPLGAEPPPIERILEVSLNHGIEILGPPGTMPSSTRTRAPVSTTGQVAAAAVSRRAPVTQSDKRPLFPGAARLVDESA